MDDTGIVLQGLVAILINYDEDEAERRLVVCSAYLTYDSEEPLQTSNSEELVRYCEEENYYQSQSPTPINTIRCEVAPIAIIVVWHGQNSLNIRILKFQMKVLIPPTVGHKYQR